MDLSLLSIPLSAASWSQPLWTISQERVATSLSFYTHHLTPCHIFDIKDFISDLWRKLYQICLEKTLPSLFTNNGSPKTANDHCVLLSTLKYICISFNLLIPQNVISGTSECDCIHDRVFKDIFKLKFRLLEWILI